MDLILWRHAEAEDSFDDHERKLTKLGERQASRMAAWLLAHLPEDCVILASPAVRTRQTASALGRPVKIDPRLAPGRSPAELIAVAGWPERTGTTLIVGHQPTLGRVAALLLAHADDHWSVKKGAVWWISADDREEGVRTVLRAAIAPEML